MRDARAQLPCQTKVMDGVEGTRECGACDSGGCTTGWAETYKYQVCAGSNEGAFWCRSSQFGVQATGKNGTCSTQYNWIALTACLVGSGLGGAAVAFSSCVSACLWFGVSGPLYAGCVAGCAGGAGVGAALAACMSHCGFVQACVRDNGNYVFTPNVETGPSTCPTKI